jgi:hypothetical protein
VRFTGAAVPRGGPDDRIHPHVAQSWRLGNAGRRSPRLRWRSGWPHSGRRSTVSGARAPKLGDRIQKRTTAVSGSLEHSVAGHHAPLYSAVSCNWGCQRSWCDRSPRRGLVFVDGPEPLQRLLRELRASPIVTRCCSPDTSPTGVDSSPFRIATDCMIPESIHR